MSIHELFDQAVKDIRTLSQRPANDTLLQLYALYKQATLGDVTPDPPANGLDFIAKAKYQAWANVKGKTKENAMQEYVNLIEKLKT